MDTSGIMESVYRYTCSQHVMDGMLGAAYSPGNEALDPSRGKGKWFEERRWELPVLLPFV